MESDPSVRTLYDDWQARRARLADLAAAMAGGPADYHVVELRLLDYLLRRYRGSPEAARCARFPLSTAVFVDHRALTVHHHLGRGQIPTITNAREALAHVRSIVDRMRSPAAEPEGGAVDEAAPFAMPPLADPAEAARGRLCSGDAAVRLRAALELGKIGTLDDVGLLSDLLSLPVAPDEHPRERAAILYAMQKLSGQAVEPFDPPVRTWDNAARLYRAREQMAWLIRLYWWMAACGLLIVWLVGSFCISWQDGGPWSLLEDGLLCYCVGSVPIFLAAIYVAERLAISPQGMLVWARLMGITLAAWMPIFLLPAVWCVETLTAQFDAYCEAVRGS